ncbi:hypothetical protein [Maricaulis parjimensis]|uniref:hypothetical protein n=1 Tax=Maricaulis parjimensis TaxID=144023 RepID=UPI00193ACD1F|nr:hypothetical protein [Maricaulis parjimensis]
MGIKRRTRIWTTVGTAALVGGLAACSDPAGEVGESGAHNPATSEHAQNGSFEAPSTPAFSEGEGESGEGEGGGGGGEFGIDPVAAENDPVVYGIAIEVMRAHYLAGIDAFQAGDRTAGAEMFAHPISEIYIDFEPVLEALGSPLFGETMTAAAVAPYSGESDEEIAAKVEAVITALDDAEAYAPQNDASAGAVQARILADLVERAALQYRLVASTPDAGEAYLDGYGFTKGAERYADRHMNTIALADPTAAAGLASAIALLQTAFPTPLRPETLSADADMIVAASDTLKAALPALD